jgi:hypothetical protein
MAGSLEAGAFPSTWAFGNWTVSAGLQWDHYRLLVNPNAVSSPGGGNLDTKVPAALKKWIRPAASPEMMSPPSQEQENTAAARMSLSSQVRRTAVLQE